MFNTVVSKEKCFKGTGKECDRCKVGLECKSGFCLYGRCVSKGNKKHVWNCLKGKDETDRQAAAKEGLTLKE